MSGSETNGATSRDATARTDTKLSRLFAEIQDERESEPGEFGQFDDGAADRRPEELREVVLDALAADEAFRFDDGVVKQSLEELLVVLVAMRSEGANGKALMADLAAVFDSQLSPGTVYPALHELGSDGVLEMFELVRSKEYRVDDREQAAAMVDDAARQHLALGAFLHAAATEL